MNKFLSFYKSNTYLPGPLDRQTTDESRQQGDDGRNLVSLFKEQTLPYSEQSLAEMKVMTLPVPAYDIDDMTDEWMVSTGIKEKCGCGGPKNAINRLSR